MRLHLLTTLLFLSSRVLIAQQNQLYKGVVLDAKTNEIIPFATVTVYNESAFVSGVSTNDTGKFNITIRAPFTSFKVSFMGYETLIAKRIDIKNEKAITFRLKALISELDEVVVQGERTTTQLKIDRKVINLGADVQQAGATALEAFDQISEIQTDLSTGSLSLRGNSNVRLLINGKPSGLNATEILEQLPAASIQRVEIITSPSSKNQADGLSGIINIITNKNTFRGLNANLNAGVGTKRYNYGIDGNYNFSPFNMRWNASQAGREMDSKQTIAQRYINGATRDFFAPHDFNGLVRKMAIGLDIFINDNNELSLGLDYTNDYHSFYNDTFYSNVTGREDFVYTRNSSHTHNTLDVNANYRTRFRDKKHFLEFDYQFSKNRNLFPAIDFEANVFLFEEERKNTNTLHALAIDYSLPVSDNIVLETGFSYNGRRLESTNRIVPREEIENFEAFDYNESLYGVYLQSRVKTHKLNWQLGLRYEKLMSDAVNVTADETLNLTFSDLFPTVHISYDINDSNTVNLGYSKRVSRPNFRHINPFQSRNQYFEWVANPNLKPEFSNNMESNYQYKGSKFNASAALFYRYRTAVIEQVQEIDKNGVQSISFDNIGEKSSYGIETNIDYKAMPFWNIGVSTNYYHTIVNSTISLTWDQLYSSNLILKNTFKINKALQADISFRQNFKTQNTFNFIEPRNRIDLAIRLKLLENRFMMNLRIVDILDNNLMFRRTVTQNVVQDEVWRFQSQTFGFLLSASYKLFQNKGKSRNRKSRNYQYGGTTD